MAGKNTSSIEQLNKGTTLVEEGVESQVGGGIQGNVDERKIEAPETPEAGQELQDQGQSASSVEQAVTHPTTSVETTTDTESQETEAGTPVSTAASNPVVETEIDVAVAEEPTVNTESSVNTDTAAVPSEVPAASADTVSDVGKNDLTIDGEVPEKNQVEEAFDLYELYDDTESTEKENTGVTGRFADDFAIPAITQHNPGYGPVVLSDAPPTRESVGEFPGDQVETRSNVVVSRSVLSSQRKSASNRVERVGNWGDSQGNVYTDVGTSSCKFDNYQVGVVGIGLENMIGILKLDPYFANEVNKKIETLIENGVKYDGIELKPVDVQLITEGTREDSYSEAKRLMDLCNILSTKIGIQAAGFKKNEIAKPRFIGAQAKTLKKNPVTTAENVMTVEIVLFEGSGIRMHPVTASMLTADFDGDDFSITIKEDPRNAVGNFPTKALINSTTLQTAFDDGVLVFAAPPDCTTKKAVVDWVEEYYFDNASIEGSDIVADAYAELMFADSEEYDEKLKDLAYAIQDLGDLSKYGDDRHAYDRGYETEQRFVTKAYRYGQDSITINSMIAVGNVPVIKKPSNLLVIGEESAKEFESLGIDDREFLKALDEEFVDGIVGINETEFKNAVNRIWADIAGQNAGFRQGAGLMKLFHAILSEAHIGSKKRYFARGGKYKSSAELADDAWKALAVAQNAKISMTTSEAEDAPTSINVFIRDYFYRMLNENDKGVEVDHGNGNVSSAGNSSEDGSFHSRFRFKSGDGTANSSFSTLLSFLRVSYNEAIGHLNDQLGVLVSMDNKLYGSKMNKKPWLSNLGKLYFGKEFQNAMSIILGDRTVEDIYGGTVVFDDNFKDDIPARISIKFGLWEKKREYDLNGEPVFSDFESEVYKEIECYLDELNEDQISFLEKRRQSFDYTVHVNSKYRTWTINRFMECNLMGFVDPKLPKLNFDGSGKARLFITKTGEKINVDQEYVSKIPISQDVSANGYTAYLSLVCLAQKKKQQALSNSENIKKSLLGAAQAIKKLNAIAIKKNNGSNSSKEKKEPEKLIHFGKYYDDLFTIMYSMDPVVFDFFGMGNWDTFSTTKYGKRLKEIAERGGKDWDIKDKMAGCWMSMRIEMVTRNLRLLNSMEKTDERDDKIRDEIDRLSQMGVVWSLIMRSTNPDFNNEIRNNITIAIENGSFQNSSEKSEKILKEAGENKFFSMGEGSLLDLLLDENIGYNTKAEIIVEIASMLYNESLQSIDKRCVLDMINCDIDEYYCGRNAPGIASSGAVSYKQNQGWKMEKIAATAEEDIRLAKEFAELKDDEIKFILKHAVDDNYAVRDPGGMLKSSAVQSILGRAVVKEAEKNRASGSVTSFVKFLFARKFGAQYSDVQRVDNKMLNIAGYDQISEREIRHLIADGNYWFTLTAPDGRHKKIDREFLFKYYGVDNGSPVSKIKELIKADPVIARALLGSFADAKGYLYSPKSFKAAMEQMREYDQRLSDTGVDHYFIARLEDKPSWFYLVALFTDIKGKTPLEISTDFSAKEERLYRLLKLIATEVKITKIVGASEATAIEDGIKHYFGDAIESVKRYVDYYNSKTKEKKFVSETMVEDLSKIVEAMVSEIEESRMNSIPMDEDIWTKISEQENPNKDVSYNVSAANHIRESLCGAKTATTTEIEGAESANMGIISTVFSKLGELGDFGAISVFHNLFRLFGAENLSLQAKKSGLDGFDSITTKVKRKEINESNFVDPDVVRDSQHAEYLYNRIDDINSNTVMTIEEKRSEAISLLADHIKMGQGAHRYPTNYDSDYYKTLASEMVVVDKLGKIHIRSIRQLSDGLKYRLSRMADDDTKSDLGKLQEIGQRICITDENMVGREGYEDVRDVIGLEEMSDDDAIFWLHQVRLSSTGLPRSVIDDTSNISRELGELSKRIDEIGNEELLRRLKEEGEGYRVFKNEKGEKRLNTHLGNLSAKDAATINSRVANSEVNLVGKNGEKKRKSLLSEDSKWITEKDAYQHGIIVAVGHRDSAAASQLIKVKTGYDRSRFYGDRVCTLLDFHKGNNEIPGLKDAMSFAEQTNSTILLPVSPSIISEHISEKRSELKKLAVDSYQRESLEAYIKLCEELLKNSSKFMYVDNNGVTHEGTARNNRYAVRDFHGNTTAATIAVYDDMISVAVAHRGNPLELGDSAGLLFNPIKGSVFKNEKYTESIDVHNAFEGFEKEAGNHGLSYRIVGGERLNEFLDAFYDVNGDDTISTGSYGIQTQVDSKNKISNEILEKRDSDTRRYINTVIGEYKKKVNMVETPILGIELSPGDCAAIVEAFYIDDAGVTHSQYAPLIPIPVDKKTGEIKKKSVPTTYVIDDIRCDGSTVINVDIQPTSRIRGGDSVKVGLETNAAVKLVCRAALDTEEELNRWASLKLPVLDSAKLFCAFVWDYAKSRFPGSLALATWKSMYMASRLDQNVYNFAEDDSTFPDYPELRQKLLNGILKITEWKSLLDNGDIVWISGNNTMNAWLNKEARRWIKYGINPTNMLATCFHTGEIGSDGNPVLVKNPMTPESAFAFDGSPFDDEYINGMLSFYNFVCPSLCPPSLDSSEWRDSSEYFFQPIEENEGTINKGVLYGMFGDPEGNVTRQLLFFGLNYINTEKFTGTMSTTSVGSSLTRSQASALLVAGNKLSPEATRNTVNFMLAGARILPDEAYFNPYEYVPYEDNQDDKEMTGE